MFLGGVLCVLFWFSKLMESVLCWSTRFPSSNSRVIFPRDVQKWTGCMQLTIEGSSFFGKSAAAWQLCIFLPCSKTEVALSKEPLREGKFGVKCCQMSCPAPLCLCHGLSQFCLIKCCLTRYPFQRNSGGNS